MSTTLPKDTYRTVASGTSDEDLEITVRARVERSTLLGWALYVVLAFSLPLLFGRPALVLSVIGIFVRLVIVGFEDAGLRVVQRRLVLRRNVLSISSLVIPFRLVRVLDVNDVERFEASYDGHALEAVLADGDRRSIALGHLEEGDAEKVARSLNERLG